MKNSIRRIFPAAVMALVAVTASLGAKAELAATPLSGDTRLVTFEYDPENTYLVLSKPRAQTHIKIPDGETIETVMAGDTASWDFTPSKNGKNLFIKPKYDDIQTPLTIITTKRTYQIYARSTGDNRKWYQQVSWEIAKGFVVDNSSNEPVESEPTLRLAKQAQQDKFQLNPEKVNYKYSISGSAKFKPSQVFDDGKMIWVKMPDGVVELPAFFAKEGRDLVLINYVVRDKFVVVQQLVDKLVLKIGKEEVEVSRGTGGWSWGSSSNYVQ